MNSEENRPTYRQRYFRKKEPAPKKYRRTYELIDEATGQVAARCDLVGQAMFKGLEIDDADAKRWRLRANRRIMPTRWALHDPSDTVVLQFDQKVLGKLKNFFTGSDRGFVSAGDDHLLPAPAVLALLLLFDEVTDTSGGD